MRRGGVLVVAGWLPKPIADLRSRAMFGPAAPKALLSLVEQSLISGTNFLTTILVGRLCGPAGLGLFSLGFTAVVLIVNVQEALVATPYTIYGNRLQGAERAQYAGNVLLHFCLLAMAAITCLAAAAGLLSAGIGPSGLASVMWMLALVVPFLLLRELCRRFAYAHLHVGAALGVAVTVSVIHLGGVLWLAAIGELSPACAYAPLGVACGIAGVSWLMWNRASFQIHWRGLPQTIRRDWYLGKWILATGVTSALTTYSMPWLLALLVGARATGVYAACAAVVCLVNPPVLGISNVLTPKTAQAFAERGCGELQHLVRRTTLVLGGAMGAFCGFAVLFGDLLLRLLFGREFSGNRQMVGVLAVGVLASFIVLAHGSALLSIERPDMNVAARAVGLLVALAAGLCLIWPFGSLGAAYSLLAGNAVAATVTRIAYGRLVCRAYEGSPP